MTRRTKSSVAEGIAWSSTSGQTVFVEYQPGNGTRYPLLVTSYPTGFGDGLGAKSLKLMGFGPADSVFSVLNTANGRGWVFRDDPSLLAPSYVAEKLRCSMDDAYVIAELLGHLTEREAVGAGEPS